MEPKRRADPISIGMVVIGLTAYALIAVVTVSEGRPFGWAELKSLWPMHLVVALLVLNLVARSTK